MTQINRAPTPAEEREARRICRESGEDSDAPRWHAYVEQARAYLSAKAAAGKTP